MATQLDVVKYLDGTNVEAVYHGPVERSAASVVFSWDE
ncbi:hypothetical protein BH18ACT13_BH18ACT13_17080 [soil metagenome]